ncbi:dienelactone hydrolase family protein [Acuticoccus kandeliae]|uniref:dienelactone hydrolase family protein n=1 Tax=Acuticoccus kandeliae TaxID=2073160 RepID=UPI000D3ECCC4|nr:alpha/beta family hydrolase [Acuticoccus kandeliae]
MGEFETATRQREVSLRVGAETLHGTLDVPAGARGVVVFAHGSGSSRHSPRNRAVARLLRERGMGTLLIDLLSAREEAIDRNTAHLRFDIPMLAERLGAIGDWVIANAADDGPLALGYFGASTGAAAALVAAARQGNAVAAVVSRGGRPDLAGDALEHVRAPTLLIVGTNDVDVVALNRKALRSLNEDSRLFLVPGATHLFEEKGALETVAEAAADWFVVAFGEPA